MENEDRLLSEREASKVLGLAALTLRNMRCMGHARNGGPEIPYYRYSARCIRYRQSDLNAWMEAKRVHSAGGAA